jgi:hypothetical protein
VAKPLFLQLPERTSRPFSITTFGCAASQVQARPHSAEPAAVANRRSTAQSREHRSRSILSATARSHSSIGINVTGLARRAANPSIFDIVVAFLCLPAEFLFKPLQFTMLVARQPWRHQSR